MELLASWFTAHEQIEQPELIDVSNDLRERQFKEITEANKALRRRVAELSATSAAKDALLTELSAKTETLQTEVSITNDALSTANQQHAAQMLLVQCQHGEEIKKHELLQQAFADKVMLCIQQTQEIDELNQQLEKWRQMEQVQAQEIYELNMSIGQCEIWSTQQSKKIKELSAQLDIAKHSASEQTQLAKQRGDDLAKINEHLRALDVQLNAFQDEHEGLKKQYDQTVSKCTHLQNELKKFQQSESEWERVSDQLSEEIKKLVLQGQDWFRQIQKLQENYDENAQKLQDVKDEMEEMTLERQEFELESARLKNLLGIEMELAIEKKEEMDKLVVSLEEAKKAKEEAEVLLAVKEEAVKAVHLDSIVHASTPSTVHPASQLAEVCEQTQTQPAASEERARRLRANKAKAVSAKKLTKLRMQKLRDAKAEKRRSCSLSVSEEEQENSESHRKRARSDTGVEPDGAPTRKRFRASSLRSAKAKTKNDVHEEVQATYTPRTKCPGTTFVGTERMCNGKSVQFTCKWLVGDGEECLFTCATRKQWTEHCIEVHTLNGNPITRKVISTRKTK